MAWHHFAALRLRPCATRSSRQRSSACCKMQELATGKFHFAPSSRFTSFDNLVGSGKQRRWHFEAESFGGLEVAQQIMLVDPPSDQRHRISRRQRTEAPCAAVRRSCRLLA